MQKPRCRCSCHGWVDGWRCITWKQLQYREKHTRTISSSSLTTKRHTTRKLSSISTFLTLINGCYQRTSSRAGVVAEGAEPLLGLYLVLVLMPAPLLLLSLLLSSQSKPMSISFCSSTMGARSARETHFSEEANDNGDGGGGMGCTAM